MFSYILSSIEKVRKGAKDARYIQEKKYRWIVTEALIIGLHYCIWSDWWMTKLRSQYGRGKRDDDCNLCLAEEEVWESISGRWTAGYKPRW